MSREDKKERGIEEARGLPLPPSLKSLGLVAYQPIWQAMKQFTTLRTADTRDEIWLLQHPPVYTQGLAGKPEHLPHATDTPVIKTDRGGQITYHGPGQIIAYLLLDLRRWRINVRELVRLMEQAVIDLLEQHGIAARGREDAPGVYVADAKIASLGLKIRNGCCYHGLALNVDMELAPFKNINPCGFSNLLVTQTVDLGVSTSLEKLEKQISQNLVGLLQKNFERKMHEHS